MRRTAVVIAMLLMLISALAASPADGADPTRASVDLQPTIVYPAEGASLEAEGGLVANVTVSNLGDGWANNTCQVGFKIINRENGRTVFSPLSRTLSGIPPGGSENVMFPNWSRASAGSYRCEVTTSYIGDTNFLNNDDQVRFTMFTENWERPPELKTWTVNPAKGNTSTLFTYSVEYVYDKMPEIIRVEIDGENHTMYEQDPTDQVTEDGKDFIYRTTLPPGNHEYRFLCEVDDEKAEVPDPDNHTAARGPWVNVTLRYASMSPFTGYVTSNFEIKVNYGSTKNLHPDEIYVTIHGKKFHMEQYSQTPIYTSGNVEFLTTVAGFEMIPSPVNLSFYCSVDGDEVNYGPFEVKGPSMAMGNLTGNVTDPDGEPVEGAIVSLTPGQGVNTTTGPDGSYLIRTYEGRRYTLTCSKGGYYNTTYRQSINVNGNEERTLNIDLRPLPEMGTVSGTVLGSNGDSPAPMDGAEVKLSKGSFSRIARTGSDGRYEFTDVDPGSDYLLEASSPRHVNSSLSIDVGEGEHVVVNVTLQEKEQPFTLIPTPGGGPIPVDTEFEILFPAPVNISTLVPELKIGEEAVPHQMVLDREMTNVTIIPDDSLLFNETYRLRIQPEVRSVSGEVMVWRMVDVTYETELQPSGEKIAVSPSPNSMDVPLEAEMTIWFDIALDPSSLDFGLYKVYPVEKSVDASLTEVANSFNRSDSNRSSCRVTISPDEDLEYGTQYFLLIREGLEDLYGRELLEDDYLLEFTTVPEGDTDCDGFPDSADSFPEDPSAAVDSDGDGYPDSWLGDYSGSPVDQDLILDAFPDDPSAWLDTDGDGKPDSIKGESVTGLVPDDDNDGDGMPNEWETKYGLDPADPGDAHEDLDGDGVSNVVEYMDGTDPTDSSDHRDSGANDAYLPVTVGIIVILILIAAAVIFFILRRGNGPGALEE